VADEDRRRPRCGLVGDPLGELLAEVLGHHASRVPDRRLGVS
jgi:hypothetical protein